MFRKIHSNRDPRDTLFSEIKKEFGVYFTIAGGFFRKIAHRNPRTIFSAMIVLMIISLITSFFLVRHPANAPSKFKVIHNSPMQDGFDQLLIAGQKLKRTIQLKHIVDSLSLKPQLTARDSLALDSALDDLHSIQKTIK